MKVLVATHSYSGNGAAVMLLAVIDYWIKQLGWTVDVLLELDADVPEELAQTGACTFSSADPKNYDFALVNTIISANYVDMLAPHVRTVLWVHEGETVLMGSSAPADKWQHLFAQPWKNIFQTAWQSEAVFKTFLLKTPPERIACVRNGLPPVPANIVAMPNAEGKKRIAFLGGVYGRKRPHDLVEAVLALGRSDVECFFVGPAENIDTIGSEHVEKIKAHPELFKLAGQLDRLRGLEILAGADVFCLPSGDESQPIAPLEAATLGVPCVLTDLPPYFGIWTHGRNCLLHPVGDTALLRWNLTALLDDAKIRARLIEGARDLLDRFTIGSFLQRFTAEMPP